MIANTSIKVGNLTLSNRICVPPIVRMLANENGDVTDKLLEDYMLHASSGASLLTVEACYVHKSGQILPNQLSIEDDSKVEGLGKLASAIKSHGIPALVQLVHAGRMSCNKELIAPSPVPFENRAVPAQMTSDDIEALKDWYRKAIKRAIDAGFDGVEIHAAHGYILSQFLSPLTNKRTDNYGGNLENRSRLLFEIVDDARKIIGKNKVLSVRFGACDCYAGGLKLSESVQTAKKLEIFGADMISVSIGITPTSFGGSRTRKTMGFAPLSRQIKKSVNIPISVAGRITTQDHVETMLGKGDADIVNVCRALLSDPKWPAKTLNQDNNPITSCKLCKTCVHYISGCPK
jgi:2,4-dienoyl-CoA reductase-like NADH-dependent reductase (Old Yellow Enzyme family)